MQVEPNIIHINDDDGEADENREERNVIPRRVFREILIERRGYTLIRETRFIECDIQVYDAVVVAYYEDKVNTRAVEHLLSRYPESTRFIVVAPHITKALPEPHEFIYRGMVLTNPFRHTLVPPMVRITETHPLVRRLFHNNQMVVNPHRILTSDPIIRLWGLHAGDYIMVGTGDSAFVRLVTPSTST